MMGSIEYWIVFLLLAQIVIVFSQKPRVLGVGY
jgi:hypothetical protein